MRKMKRTLKILAVTVLAAAAVFFMYMGQYYRADETALAALESDRDLEITRIKEGWFFDGPGDDTALIFYPGAKVEEKAYAPLLHLLSENGIDVFLVKMPFHFALFDTDKADGIIDGYHYDRYFIAGHSLGGVAASCYAEDHPDKLDGIIFLASYPYRKINDRLLCISIYGSRDTILDQKSYQKNLKNVSEHFAEHVIEGGNHGQFGSYGMQKGDQEASIPASQQTEVTADIITAAIMNE